MFTYLFAIMNFANKTIMHFNSTSDSKFLKSVKLWIVNSWCVSFRIQIIRFVWIFHYYYIYLKHSSILVFFIVLLKLFGENRLAKYVKYLLFNIKSINLVHQYPHIIIYLNSKNVWYYYIFVTYDFFNLFWNMLNKKNIKIWYFVIPTE